MDQLVTRIGLLTATPEEDLARARQALAAGDIEDAYAAARSAESAWLIAAEVGQGRLTSMVLLALALALLVSLLVQRRRRGSPPPAAPPAAAPPTAAPPTAPEPGGEAG
jgi:crotonobetainyl-CoA:carnitine CoA-transferase CaiB-like acyl-CoA transferase